MNAAIDPRRLRLGRIHQGKKALKLSEAEYRSLLLRASAGVDGLEGVASSAIMTEAQHLAVLQAMAQLGFKRADVAGRKAQRWPGEPKDSTSRPLLRKVRALLASGNKPWSYAHAMAQHMFGVARTEWLHDGDLRKLVAAMQVDAQRRK